MQATGLFSSRREDDGGLREGLGRTNHEALAGVECDRIRDIGTGGAVNPAPGAIQEVVLVALRIRVPEIHEVRVVVGERKTVRLEIAEPGKLRIADIGIGSHRKAGGNRNRIARVSGSRPDLIKRTGGLRLIPESLAAGDAPCRSLRW